MFQKQVMERKVDFQWTGCSSAKSDEIVNEMLFSCACRYGTTRVVVRCVNLLILSFRYCRVGVVLLLGIGCCHSSNHV